MRLCSDGSPPLDVMYLRGWAPKLCAPSRQAAVLSGQVSCRSFSTLELRGNAASPKEETVRQQPAMLVATLVSGTRRPMPVSITRSSLVEVADAVEQIYTIAFTENLYPSTEDRRAARLEYAAEHRLS